MLPPPCPTASRSPRWSRTSPPPVDRQRRRCSPAAPTVGNDVLRRHHRRPRPVRRLQRRRAACRRGRDQGRRARRHGLLGHRRRPQGRELLPLPRLQARPARSPASATARPTRTPRRSASTSSTSSSSGEVDRVELVYTRFISAGIQEVVLRPLVPLERETVAGGDGKAGRRRRPAGRLRVRARSRRTILDTLLPRYVEARIYAALLNAAAQRARLPPAGDEDAPPTTPRS